MGKTVTKSVLPASELDSVLAGRPGRVLKVNVAEADGIRNILANPKPPTPELKAAWEAYVRYTADNPDSNW